MEEVMYLFVAKLLDWPTMLAGVCAGLLAWSRWGVGAMAVVAAIAAEVILSQVRGWPVRPSWVAIGVAAVLPWAALGFLIRVGLVRLLGKAKS